MSREREVYERSVREEFAFLKGTDAVEHLHARSIVLPEGRGLLVPVCALHAGDRRLVADLASWREASAFAFPTQFPVTEAGTARWLRNGVLDVEDRILFLVLDRHGHPAGHLGFAGSLEVDNVVRGVKDGERGLMSAAMEGLLRWAHEVLGAHEIHLRVFEDNDRAVSFYERLGFVRGETTPLRRVEHEPGVVAYVPGEPADRTFLTMTYAPAPSSEGTILTAGP